LIFRNHVERETTIHINENPSSSSFAAKLDDFFNGIFIPAAMAFENIREQIRLDKEKTWQGIRTDDTSKDSPWPKPYVALVQ